MIHILNGDALSLQLSEHFTPSVIFRECLIEGPSRLKVDAEFWGLRRDYFYQAYGISQSEYDAKVRNELNQAFRMVNIEEINLWFEFDLFCQTNLWFVIAYLRQKKYSGRISWVFPTHSDWTGFAMMNKNELIKAFSSRKNLSISDQEFYSNLWRAYALKDRAAITDLASCKKATEFGILPALHALLDLHPTQGLPKPLFLLKHLMVSELDFNEILQRFSNEAGVYGYGDLQVKNMIDHLKRSS